MPDDPAEATPYEPQGLLQKLAAITDELRVHMTGKFSIEKEGRVVHTAAAISIGDVEEALAPLFAKHRLVSSFSFNAAPVRGSGERLYLVDLDLTIFDADTDGDLKAHLYDVGSTPGGAVSFAIKRYYKALFHITDDEGQETDIDEVVQETARAERNPASRRPSAADARIPPLPGISWAHWSELLTIAKALPAGTDDSFVQNPDWAEKKLIARLKHHAKDGDAETAYHAMKAELAAYDSLPAPRGVAQTEEYTG